jgi:hypothetical protein
MRIVYFDRMQGLGRKRQPYRDTGAVAHAGTGSLDCSALQFHQGASDCESQSQAAVAARDGGIGLAEALEHFRNKKPARFLRRYPQFRS